MCNDGTILDGNVCDGAAEFVAIIGRLAEALLVPATERITKVTVVAPNTTIDTASAMSPAFHDTHVRHTTPAVSAVASTSIVHCTTA